MEMENIPFVDDNIQQGVNPYRSSDKDNLLVFKSNSSIPSRGVTNFASTVRKLATQNSDIWKFDRNGTINVNVGSSRSSHVLASSHNSGQWGGFTNGVLPVPASAWPCMATPTVLPKRAKCSALLIHHLLMLKF